MFSRQIGRRGFLCLGVAAGAGFAVGAGAAKTVRAFQIQDMPGPQLRQYLLACEAPAKHAQLLAELDAELQGRKLSAAEIAAVRQSATCPICGCTLLAATQDKNPS